MPAPNQRFRPVLVAFSVLLGVTPAAGSQLFSHASAGEATASGALPETPATVQADPYLAGSAPVASTSAPASSGESAPSPTEPPSSSEPGPPSSKPPAKPPDPPATRKPPAKDTSPAGQVLTMVNA